jgi:hypothetical protein
VLQAIFRTVLIGFVFLLSSCTNNPEQVSIKDPLNISKPLSDALKDECGLYVPMNSNVSATDQFPKHKLLILGEVEGHMDTRVAGLGMQETQDFLFKEVLFIYVTLGESGPLKDSLCETKKDTLESREYKKFPREFTTYRDEKTLHRIFKQNFINSPDYIFLMTKSNAKKFSNRMKELIVE